MKKAILVALAVLLAVSVAVAGEKKVRVAMICKAMDSDFWQTVKGGAMKFAAENPDMELNVLAPDREINVQQQIQIIEDQITNEVNAIVVAPCGIQEVIPTLDKIAAANIPVVIFDGNLDWPKKKCYVGSENFDGGFLAGEFINKSLPKGGTYGMITGIMGHGPHIGRVNGCLAGLKDRADIKMLSQQPANSERSLGMTVMENMLTSFPDIDFVFATNDEMALGASQAAQAEKSKVKIIGFDGTAEAKKAVKDGILIGTVDANASGLGYESAKAGYMAAKGQKLPETVKVTYKFISKADL